MFLGLETIISRIKLYVLILLAVWILNKFALVVYRLTLHPLAGFPGPVLARSSYLYEFWFDVVHKGRFTLKTAELHEIYGPIIRVNPDELHCIDPSFIDVLYNNGKARRHKSGHYLAAFPRGVRMASVGTTEHEEHSLRRAPVAEFLARARIMKYEDIIHEKVQMFCERLRQCDHYEPFRLTAALSCFTTDALTRFAFGRSLGNLEQPGWHPAFKGTIDSITGLFYLSRHFHALACLAEYIPMSVVTQEIWCGFYSECSRSLCRYISTDISSMPKLIRVTIPHLVERSMATKAKHLEDHTVIDTLLDSNLPEDEKTLERLTGEAVAVVLGGTHSISAVLSIATFHLLDKPSRLTRLQEELQAAVSDETQLPAWSTLEKLPYLSGVILEALRLMHGVASRISLVAPDEDLIYTESEKSTYVIPRGSAVGIAPYLVHTNPRIFPNPSEFVPDRWMDDDGQRDRYLEKYLLSFSNGPRQCVGIHLAYCELYIAMAALALRVLPRMKLHDTNVLDVAYDHDQLIAMPRTGSKGVQVTMC